MADTKKPKKGTGVGVNGNLHPKPWKKGQSGNPAGKPKGVKNRSTIFREMMDLIARDPEGKTLTTAFGNKIAPKGMTVEQALAFKMISQGLAGDVNAIEKIFDARYGKNKEVHEITGIDGGPVKSEVVETKAVFNPKTPAEAWEWYKNIQIEQ